MGAGCFAIRQPGRPQLAGGREQGGGEGEQDGRGIGELGAWVDLEPV